MIKIKKNKNKLIIGEDILIEFSYDIQQLLIDGSKIYILLKPSLNQTSGYNEYHNIYCYDIDGNLVWQIGERAKDIDDNVVFVLININNKKLYANDFFGRRFEVDKGTGTIIQNSVEITK